VFLLGCPSVVPAGPRDAATYFLFLFWSIRSLIDSVHPPALFQNDSSPKIDKYRDEKESKDPPKENSGVAVVRTESHLARFNNARALFEKLGESNILRRRAPCHCLPFFSDTETRRNTLGEWFELECTSSQKSIDRSNFFKHLLLWNDTRYDKKSNIKLIDLLKI